MQENEPRVLCGLPVGGTVGILGSVIIICQIFGLFFLSPFVLYFFEISIAFGMMFVLSTGAKRRKLAYITAYMLYISMYTFWVFFLIVGAILASVWLVDNNDNICPPKGSNVTTPRPCNPSKFSTADVVMVSLSCVFLGVSIIVAIVQLRYLLVLYHFVRSLRRSTAPGLNVQYVVPSSPSGMPPPPRYGDHAAHPIPTAEVGPNQVQVRPGPPPGPLPTKPPLYSEINQQASNSTSQATDRVDPPAIGDVEAAGPNGGDSRESPILTSAKKEANTSTLGYDNESFVTIDINDETRTDRDRTVSLPPAYEELPSGTHVDPFDAPTASRIHQGRANDDISLI